MLLDVSVKTGLGRRDSSGKMDRLDMESKEFHEKVRVAYLDLVKKDPKRWRVIDAEKSLEEVETEIWQKVSEWLGK